MMDEGSGPFRERAAAPSLSYMPRLDGLRALAIGGVLLEHFCPSRAIRSFSPGGAGVTLFFVLSGYLITRNLLLYRETGVPVAEAAAHFYWRRILRLSPPYYLAIAAAALLGLLQMHEDWWVHALYLTNFQIALRGSWGSGADHFWSLSTEEQFYLLWFFVVVMMPRGSLLWTILGCAIVAFLYRAVILLSGAPPVAIVLLPGNITSLAAGALIAYAGGSSRWTGLEKALLDKRLLVAAGVAFALVPLSPPWAYASRLLLYPCVSALFFACVVRISADPRRNRWFDWLAWAPLRHIGKISYGIFVYHKFLPGVFETLVPTLGSGWKSFFVLCACSVAVAEVSWFLIERPVLRLKHAVPVGRRNAEALPSLLGGGA